MHVIYVNKHDRIGCIYFPIFWLTSALLKVKSGRLHIMVNQIKY